jgi:LPS export ABC transporter protein LptC
VVRRWSARAAIVWALIGFGCGADLSTLRPTELELPPAELEGVRFEGYRAGSRDIEVLATRASIDPSERIALLEHVRIRLRDPVRGDVSIRAERARLDLEADDFTLEGLVHGTIGEGQHFTTSEVRYDADRELLWTDRDVSVTRSNLQLEGRGMEVDLRERKLRIKGNVRTRLGGRS